MRLYPLFLLLSSNAIGLTRLIVAFLTLGILTSNEVMATEQSGQLQEKLTVQQSHLFRTWLQRIVYEQIRQGPSPRWTHRDCAGLVRFAVAESLREHDARWLRANGIGPDLLPPELTLLPAQKALRNAWRQSDGSIASYASAIGLIQDNSRFISKNLNDAAQGDLLFFDQGDEQHLMIWMSGTIAYHTGNNSPQDNGLRAIPYSQLLQWKDTRWRPSANNPNFAGIYRLSFLAP